MILLIQKQIQNSTIQNSHRLIILDSCVFVEGKKRHGRILTAIAGKAGKYNLQLALPKIVLYEVSKVTSTSPQKVYEQISKFFKDSTDVKITKNVFHEANRLETQFFEVHRSDSIILALARTTGAILVTLDGKMRRSAKLDGIEAYSVKEFIKNWTVIV